MSVGPGTAAAAHREPPPATPLVRRVPAGDAAQQIEREWLVTNGLGGYACGTVGGAATRRYHGLLIAAHPAPLGRIMLLNHLTEHFRFPDWSRVQVGGTEQVGGTLDVHGTDVLAEFRLEMGLPVWRYEACGHVIEKRVYMPHQRNTVHITYRLLGGTGPVRIKLRPSLHFRGHDDPVTTKDYVPYTLTARDNTYEIGNERPGFPQLRLFLRGTSGAMVLEDARLANILYRVEEGRGYENVGTMWSPGHFRVFLNADADVTLIASTESWEQVLALDPETAWTVEMERRQRLLAAAGKAVDAELGAELTLAADQFIILPSRVQDAARAHATGDQARTIIAGYHWFTDWGRDTMISLEGLTLATGRHDEAGYILRTFANHVRDGLIPNFFPDHASEGVYHTADATLWFFHALHRYVIATDDFDTVRALLPTLRKIIAAHEQGTRFGIGVDPGDGLLRQGAEGYQLTWMDAKVGDWVVTPRRGKAVEINALWYNALRLMEGWLKADGLSTDNITELADKTYESFNNRFWCEPEQGLFDVVDGEQGDDNSCRPNQIFAVAMDHPVLEASRWQTVVDTVHRRLLTPLGLRTLAPGHRDYKAKYWGDLRSRDAAYHQGTVWAWLIGPFIDAWDRVYPERRAECRQFLSGFDQHLSEACLGTISEIFDAESPFTARGCAAQAWSVAEVLRATVKLAAHGE